MLNINNIMKKFLIEVPEGITKCSECPFDKYENVCLFLSENDHCERYDFNQINIEEYHESTN